MRFRSGLIGVLIVSCLGLILPVSAQETTHTVLPGESLFRIAMRYEVSVSDIAAANEIGNTWMIYAGQRLTIPTEGAVEAAELPAANAPETAPAELQTHTVQGGDTLLSIARRYNLTPSQLAALNEITNPNLIYAGQRLIVSGSIPAPVTEAGVAGSPTLIPPATSIPLAVFTPLPRATSIPPTLNAALALPTAAPPTSSEPAIHIVRSGESLGQIAARYGVSYLAITQANNINNPNLINAGQRLTIPGAQNTSSGGAGAVAGSLLGEAGILDVPAAPAPVVGVGREIIVDLSDSRTYAYLDGVLVRNVLASTGRSVTPTVQGSFTVQRKYAAQTMSGPGYYLPDVPYVMYFYAGYALHGTYWHSNWGERMSHGCVNLPTSEAEWFYQFSEVGTPVNVQS